MKKFMFAMSFILVSVSFANAQTTMTNVLTWNESGRATEYVVERDINGGGFVEIAVVPVPTLTHTDAGLAVGNIYSWRVKARNASGISASSESCTSDTTLPNSPTLSCTVSFQ